MQTEENQAGPVEWRAIAELYRAFFTGFIMTVITRRNPSDAAELVFRFFRRQHQEYFLPGLVKLGLTDLPPAVAAAQYHYLSNWIGGVRVEYAYESDRKAWIRYPPPRWIWGGTAICAIPHRSVARDAAWMARTQRCVVAESSARFCVHKANCRRAGWAGRVLSGVRSRAGPRRALGFFTSSASAVV